MASRFVQSRDARRDQETKSGGFGQSSNPGRMNTPPADNRLDRAAVAAAAKVNPSSKRERKSKSHQDPESVAPHPGHRSIPPAGRNPYQNHENLHHQPEFPQAQMQPPHQSPDIGDVFNETVTSGFDQTKSSIILDNNVPFSQQPQQITQQDYPQEQNDYEYGQDHDYDDDTMHGNLEVHPPEGQASPRQLHRKRSQDQLKQHQQDIAKNHPVDNRFHNSQRPASHPSLQIRPGYEENAPRQQPKSKKRSRASEPLREATNQPLRHQQEQPLEEEEEDQTLYQDVRGLGNGSRARDLFDEPNNFEKADGVASEYQNERPGRAQRSQGEGSSQQQEFDALLPDYDDKKLKSMQYSDLKNESWETNLKERPDGFSKELGSTDLSLEEKIGMLLAANDDNRESFFAGLPANEWNEAGDHIMAKMTELMTKLKDARARKRQLVEGFEAVYEAREKAVRGKSENYDAKLEDMKTSGKAVLRGKV